MSDTKVTVIPRLRRVIYDVWADLPTTGLRVGDLAFATDRLVLYRWSGSAWEEIAIHASSGTAAAIPTASDLPDGSLYYETDTGNLKQVQSAAWQVINSPAKYYALTVSRFQSVAGAGTFFLGSANVNDNNVVSVGRASAIDQYSTFGCHADPILFKATQWRQYGDVNNNGDGEWKLQYMDENSVWQDWVTGIATRTTADWSNWSSETEIIFQSLRIVCTAVDSAGNSYIAELEIKY